MKMNGTNAFNVENTFREDTEDYLILNQACYLIIRLSDVIKF